ncbi:universal stress protein YxiE-like [Saccostrea cucullata]|uniref:universal stress protein YxiE-like n=1 Tax=Saccostrea cuccullata TaxID=36930 RepID=UPI002ED1137F
MAEDLPGSLSGPSKRPGCTVVIAMDGSLYSQHAFEWYVENMYKKYPAEHLKDSHKKPPYLTTDPSKASELANEEERKIKEMFADWKDQIKQAGIDGCVVRTSGEPGRAIIKIARGEGADFIVMGSRGLGTLRKTFMGSVSDYIVHHAHIPVTVVRNRDEDNQ